MKVQIDMIQGKRVLHLVLEDEEVIAFDHLLNRALNTLDPQKAKPWIDLEARIDAFIKAQ